ncbi:hypothetical protein [Shimia aestuarii]|uniref:Outer membrane protein beta-barrel domain-containing protein n=1 Tax=Shimia aestuarii TaxID=254406 RepID=A0A1I4RXC3_9RHOB|nr:hypothetical protein [Shimia aestuarii]SFM56878.1 hypothetical protein SAMN04488042_10935 [Shimia aestuarii]
MFRPFTCILGLFLAADAALAGPWPRAPGTHFLSLALESPSDPQLAEQSYTSLYYEYGARNDWTLGLDIGADTLGYGKAIAFARRSIWRGDRARVAVEFGLGSQAAFQGTDVALRPGISWGRNVTLLGRHGWMSADATLTYLPRLRRAIGKLETTLGVTLGADSKILIQFTAEQETGKPATFTMTPTHAQAIGKSSFLTTSVILSPDRPARFKFGIWLQF